MKSLNLHIRYGLSITPSEIEIVKVRIWVSFLGSKFLTKQVSYQNKRPSDT